MSLSSSLASSLGSIFSRGGLSSETLPEKRAMAVCAVAYVNRLPIEILHRIFMEIIASDSYDFAWIGVLSGVCWRWNCACQHTVMWEFISKRIFVAYPLVQRLHSAPLDQSDLQLLNRMRRLGAPEQFITQHDTMKPLIAPTNRTVREAMEEVKHYLKSRSYYEYVQRRRVLVLHVFVSWALLSFSLFLATTVCLAEGIALGVVCSPNMAFFLLWMTYLSIIVIVLANVVMETHFEPKPLFCRLRKNSPLIARSATAIVVGIACVALPTLLVQINFSRAERFPWLLCGITPIASLSMWQLYVLLSYVAPDVKQQITEQRTVFRPKAIMTFLLSNVPYAYPALFAGTIFCILQYVEYGGRTYVLFAIIPVLTSLVVLTLLFLLDFCLTRHAKDFITGGCLFLLMLFPLSLAWREFRGLTLLPVVTASFLFYLTHLRLSAMRALHELVVGALHPQNRHFR
ncbi:uncharacterized protein Tco025E_03274 [Trypanosoma conorhini]|uniref:F-box domain-containing protein n=1 Tax=Trypanosoma conorhini TaxID=83891 RepID=A0A422PWM3_9TRYP|nr:uncharacterized protein Tco025E_03274 [Trypanosoma conorhini]RNF22112.1 hypothetical protein Tco025E_03274 [Trypanosoma conorhini]